MEVDITKEQKEYYLNHGGRICPFCKSHKCIETISSSETCGNQIIQEVKCPHCGIRWVDVYTLSDIENVEKGE